MWFAVILFIDTYWFSLLFILCFWIYYERIIFAEEKFLRDKYGKPYLNWTMKTPIFIPRLMSWEKPNLDFSIKNVLKREYSGLFALFFTFALFDLIENYTRFDQWYFDEFWAYSLVVIGSLTIVIRSLKKKTKILDVKGR